MDIDLNCDLGEGCGNDAELMSLITSANISCGFHAGNAETAYQALLLAGRQGVAAGAHPGFDDPEHFGRRELSLLQDELFRLCIYQVGALFALARQAGVPLRFIKPHGALYNMACRDAAVAEPVVAAAEFFQLPLVALPDSALERLSDGRCPFFREGFADRRYLPDGALVPRNRPDAFVEDPAEAVRQAEWLITVKKVKTLCVHGDNPQAVAFVRRLRHAFQERGYAIKPCT
ncbi:MAG: 5-oxoprolinase subunit PxpA [Gemmataceae bacterium]